MTTKTFSVSLLGLEPQLIEVEVDARRGVPSLIIIGLPTPVVGEAKERLTSALLQAGIKLKAKRTIVNLAPVDLKKNSSSLELAIAIALIQTTGKITIDVTDALFLGELSLDGSIKPIKNALSLVLAAIQLGFKKIFIPKSNYLEVSLLSSVSIFPVSHLNEFLKANTLIRPSAPTLLNSSKSLKTTSAPPIPIHSPHLCRCLQIAAAGRHHLLLIGPPGTGKTFTAKALEALLSPLNNSELLEIAQIYSRQGLLQSLAEIVRPFRTVHPQITISGLLGNPDKSQPGEITLAHHGILFIDEIGKVMRSKIESLRVPLEERSIVFNTHHHQITLPARFTLVAATNPCPCGFAHSQRQKCRCTPTQRYHYRQLLSGALLDRLDMHLHLSDEKEVKIIPIDTTKPSYKETLTQLQKSIRQAQEIQQNRNQQISTNNQQHRLYNGELLGHELQPFITLDAQTNDFLKHATQQLSLTQRGMYKVLSISRTIADLEGEKDITQSHIAEALQYRPHDLW